MIAANDFIEYWAAFQVVGNGANPYDPERIHLVQSAFGLHQGSPLMMWLPPWVLLWLYPILILPLELSSIAWLLLNLVFAFTSLRLFSDFFEFPKSKGLSWAYFLLFPPLLLCISIGQISLFLCFGLALVLSGMKQGLAMRQAVGCMILSLKPHLVLAFAVWYVLRQIRSREFLWVGYFIILLLISLLGTQLLFPSSLYWWWQSIMSPLPGAVPKLAWITHSIPSWLRFYLSESPASLYWPITVLPLFASLFVAVTFLSKTSAISRNTDMRFASVSIALSFLFAPFAWVYDAVILLPHYFLSIEACRYSGRKVAVGLLLIAGLLALVQIRLPIAEPVLQLWWYPAVIAVLGTLFVFRRVRKPAS